MRRGLPSSLTITTGQLLASDGQWTMDNKKGEGLSPRLNWSNIIKEFFSFRYSLLRFEFLLPDQFGLPCLRSPALEEQQNYNDQEFSLM